MVKVAVVGTGYWGQNLVRIYENIGSLKTVCDINVTALDSIRKKYPHVEVTSDYGDVINDPEISAVIIALPAAMHFDFAEKALLKGKDIYVEKPLALRIDHAEALISLAERKGRILMVGHLLHYHPAFLKLKEMANNGELGKIQYIYSNRLSLGKIRREENSLWSFAPHDISMILSLCNEMPDEVTAFGSNYLHKTIADVTTTHLTFPSGVHAHIFVSWLHPFKEHKLIVIADKRMVVFEDTQPWDRKLAVYSHSIKWQSGMPIPEKAEAEYVAVESAEPLLAECLHFLKCIENRTSPRTDGVEGLRVLKVLDQAQRSLHGGTARTTHPGETEPKKAYFVHESAFVDEPSQIGSNTKIWHFSHVLPGARIGKGCSLGQNVNVAGDAIIGDNVKIQNNVSIYSGTTIEDDVFLGPSCVLTNVTNPRSQVNRHGLYEKTLIRRGATIGANATIVCGITIGCYAFIAAGAVVAKDVPDYALMAGVPARQTGWMSRHGHKLEINKDDGIMVCPESRFTYKENAAGELRCLDLDEDQPLPEAMKTGTVTYDQMKKNRDGVVV